MAGDDDDLRLNTLHRFAKRSPRLILHEYSHCEVPAGCGGVVLRWIDPAKGVPATVRLFASAVQGSTWLDGESLTSNLALLRPGRHVVAAHVRGTKPGPQPFTIAAYYDAADEADLIPRGEPRWRATRARPAEGWAAPDFDDDAWEPPPLAPEPLIAAQADWSQHHYRRSAAEGRPVLAADGELWVRVVFTAPEAP